MATTAAVVQLVTDSEAIVKVSGNTTDSVTINIATDILAPKQIVPNGATPVANIIGFQWAGEPGAIYKVNRGATRVASLLADNGNFMDFVELFPPENTANTSNITVTIQKFDNSAVQGELWIRIRKVSGYASKIETTQFGIYDDLNAVGS